MRPVSEPRTADQSLYADVLERLAEARSLLDRLDLPDPSRQSIEARLAKVELTARSDLTHASRHLDDVLFPLRRGVEPGPQRDD